jgi:type IV pilus assembly protein PilX
MKIVSRRFRHSSWARYRTGRGAVLISGLVVLLVITLIAVTGMETTVLQERMAGNMRQNDLALQAAEAALQAGLAYIEEQSAPPAASDDGSDLVWSSCTIARAAIQDDERNHPCTRFDEVLKDWHGDPADVQSGVSYAEIAARTDGGYAGEIPGLVAQPRVYIEARYVPPLDAERAAVGAGIHYYTVAAVGYGGTKQARAIVQSTIAKVYRY